MDEGHVVLSVSAYGTTHSVVMSDAGVTCTEFFNHCVSLAKAQGYILSNIEEALELVASEVSDEIRVIKRV